MRTNLKHTECGRYNVWSNTTQQLIVHKPTVDNWTMKEAHYKNCSKESAVTVVKILFYKLPDIINIILTRPRVVAAFQRPLVCSLGSGECVERLILIGRDILQFERFIHEHLPLDLCAAVPLAGDYHLNIDT